MTKKITTTLALGLSLACIMHPAHAEEMTENIAIEMENEALQGYFENLLHQQRTIIDDLAYKVATLEQEKTTLHERCVTKNRDVQEAQDQVDALNNEIASLKKQLEQAKASFRRSERINKELTQDLQSAEKKSTIGMPASAVAGIIAGYLISGYFK